MPPESRVHIIDDDDAMRSSLVFLLEAAGLSAQGHASACDFLDRPPEDPCACLVTDIRMPGMTGLQLVKELKSRGDSTPVIVITGHGDVPLAVEAMKNGVLEFLEKPFDDEVLLGAIRRALAAQADAARREDSRRQFTSLLAGLTPRETDVLRGVLEGKANKVIAQELGISPRTVEVYRAHVMSKTGAHSLSDLVRMALSAGF